MRAEAIRNRVADRFTDQFAAPPRFLVRAPGRVNLIGEHTDYNDGFVLPLGLDREVWIAVSPRDDRDVRVWSTDFEEEAIFTLDHLERGGPAWSEYLKGVAWAMERAGHPLTGWQGVMASGVPIGAGLSSSAAVELAAARAFAVVSQLPWNPAAMATLAQQAENDWVGVNCGIMDQMISAVAREGHAMLIDCRTLETRAVPIPAETVVVVMDTATRRGLVDSAYNERRRQCEAAAKFFKVPALRDVTVDMFEAHAGELDSTTSRRARHVVTENARTLAAAEAMSSGDATSLGRLMNDSHRSLRDDFEVSSAALDAIVEIAQIQPGCHGARMTGAGFGGCAVALVDRSDSAAFAVSVAAAYEERSGLIPKIYVTEASGGAAVIQSEGNAND